MDQTQAAHALIRYGSKLIFPAWALMLFAPGWSVTQRVMNSDVLMAPLAALYLGGLVTAAASREPDDPKLDMRALSGDDPEALIAAFRKSSGVAVAWMHMLALDFFAGRWIYLDSQARNLGYKAAPFLLLTMMFGPLGLASYLLARRHLGG